MLQLKLEREGYRVTVAGDGPAALAAIAADPDLVLLDWMMPGPSGLDVCRALQAEGLGDVAGDAGGVGGLVGASVGLGSEQDDQPFSPTVVSEHVAAVLVTRS